jgi:hypothetical protein
MCSDTCGTSASDLLCARRISRVFRVSRVSRVSSVRRISRNSWGESCSPCHLYLAHAARQHVLLILVPALPTLPPLPHPLQKRETQMRLKNMLKEMEGQVWECKRRPSHQRKRRESNRGAEEKATEGVITLPDSSPFSSFVLWSSHDSQYRCPCRNT